MTMDWGTLIDFKNGLCVYDGDGDNIAKLIATRYISQIVTDKIEEDDYDVHIIFTIDCPRDIWISGMFPNGKVKSKLEITEEDDQGDYEYLGDDWKRHKHRKYVGIITAKEFDWLCLESGLMFETSATMGALTFQGWLPAISYRGGDEYSILSAYVTPLLRKDSTTEFEKFDEAFEENEIGNVIWQAFVDELEDE